MVLQISAKYWYFLGNYSIILVFSSEIESVLQISAKYRYFLGNYSIILVFTPEIELVLQISAKYRYFLGNYSSIYSRDRVGITNIGKISVFFR